MFPEDAEVALSPDPGLPDANWNLLKRPSKKLITRLEEAQELYGQRTFCDLCGKITSKHYFHCSLCGSANFDICPQCFAQGGHCVEAGHYLREFQDQNQTNVYTNIKENGRMEIVEL
jgi:hypothetical protein